MEFSHVWYMLGVLEFNWNIFVLQILEAQTFRVMHRTLHFVPGLKSFTKV